MKKQFLSDLIRLKDHSKKMKTTYNSNNRDFFFNTIKKVKYFILANLFKKMSDQKQYMVMNKNVKSSDNSCHAFLTALMINIETITNPSHFGNKCI